MRELIEEGMGRSPLDPGEALRRSVRRELPKRFYKSVTVAEGSRGGPTEGRAAGQAGFAILLDGRPVKTPAHNGFAAPSRVIADVIAAEWAAQGEVIDPATMPMTRLANSIIDGIAPRTDETAADITKFFGSDLLFYRADGPEENEKGMQVRRRRWDRPADKAIVQADTAFRDGARKSAVPIFSRERRPTRPDPYGHE